MSTYEVTDYGAVAGTADNTVAFQSAIDACGAAGGGTVHVGTGDWQIKTRSFAGGQWACLSISYDDVTLENEGRIICDTPGTAALFFLSGGAKAAREHGGVPLSDDWIDYSALEFSGQATLPTTYYDLTQAATFPKGSNQVTLANSSHASHFAVGDWVAIRTGQTWGTVGGQSSVGEPDGEYQQITAITGGAISFPASPGLKTTYAKERYVGVAGTFPDGGITSPSGAGGGALFAIGNVDDRCLWNTTIRGGTIEQRDPEFVYFGEKAMNLTVENVTARCNTWGLDGGGRSRYRTVRDSTVIVYNANSEYWIGADVMCSDFEYSNVTLVADNATAIHCGEGVARMDVHDCQFYAKQVTGNEYLISSNSREYDISIENCVFSGGGTVVTIFVETDDRGAGVPSGRVQNCTFANGGGADPFVTGGTMAHGWNFDERTAQIAGGPVIVRKAHEAGRAQ